MKIAGVAGAKHPTLKKGDIIPLTPKDKVEIMAKHAVVDMSPSGHMNTPLEAKLIGEVEIIRGRAGGKKEDPTQYIGTCTVTYRPFNLSTDKVFASKKCKIKMHIKDVKNDIGVEDLETIEATLL